LGGKRDADATDPIDEYKRDAKSQGSYRRDAVPQEEYKRDAEPFIVDK
jgi:hypothetical protein